MANFTLKTQNCHLQQKNAQSDVDTIFTQLSFLLFFTYSLIIIKGIIKSSLMKWFSIFCADENSTNEF